MIYCDIDGTLTLDDEPNGRPNWRVIKKLQELIHFKKKKVIIWSARGENYAKEFCKKYDIVPYLCLTKPSMIIDDNPNIRPIEKMKKVTPQEFLELIFD